MIRLEQVRLPIDPLTRREPWKEKAALLDAAASLLHVAPEEILTLKLARHAIDARKKPSLYDVCTLDVTLSPKREAKIRLPRANAHRLPDSVSRNPSLPEIRGEEVLTERPVIVGGGPAGLACAYRLAACGYRPLLIERGGDTAERDLAVERFKSGGILDPENNIQFGLGGAGTYSDGKLNTGVKDREGYGASILSLFVRMGAPEDILYEAHPHIGTDQLKIVIGNLRAKIERLGGEVRTGVRFTGLLPDAGACAFTGIRTSDGDLPAGAVVLAIGHSARDTFAALSDAGVHMEQKAFAVGFRVAHTQELIDRAQYGIPSGNALPPAVYKLTTTMPDGRGVYSFCMCPGGRIVNASSEEGGLCVNGMSYRARDGRYANSAIVITVSPEDYATSSDPLAGVAFQRAMEAHAMRAGEGKIPFCTLGDLSGGSVGRQGELSGSESMRGFDPAAAFSGAAREADLSGILPEYLKTSLLGAFPSFGRMIRGFDDADTILAGVESRTSSPVRILRGENGCSVSHDRLYPCGEGAGYAGGIMSAAMDGMRTADKLIARFAPLRDGGGEGPAGIRSSAEGRGDGSPVSSGGGHG